ncbi:MAG: class I SAM-dependent methyltransferase [bacterium]
MAKENEIRSFDNITDEQIRCILGWPFLHPNRGKYLMEIGCIMPLLPPPPAKLLDLGCGVGWTSVFFARSGYEVTGVDIAENKLCLANKIAARENPGKLCFITGDYEMLEFDCEFDCAVFFDSLHHAENEQAAVESVFRALKPGGVCITVEPGIFHSRRQASIEAVKHKGTTEKDMPPFKIIRAGKKAGFTNFRIFPQPGALYSVIYGQTDRKLLAKIIKVPLLRALAGAFLILVYPRFSGVVVMNK